MRIWLKKHKNVDGIFNVSSCGKWNKKIFKNSDFCFQLPALLVEKFHENSQFMP